jgi:hypothetical protein
MAWKSMEADKWGPRSEYECKCGSKTFLVVKEREREKKHPGKRADRIAVICTNPQCEDGKEMKTHRVGWPVRRSLN